MLKIGKDGRITLTRGDTASLQLYLDAYYDDGKHHWYEPHEFDTVTFTLKETPHEDSEVIFEKNLIELSFFLIDKKDTAHLKPGIYYYDVQILTEDGDRYTVVPPSVFEITWEVNTE